MSPPILCEIVWEIISFCRSCFTDFRRKNCRRSSASLINLSREWKHYSRSVITSRITTLILMQHSCAWYHTSHTVYSRYSRRPILTYTVSSGTLNPSIPHQDDPRQPAPDAVDKHTSQFLTSSILHVSGYNFSW